ncbi:MAG TPA: hypothetical protein VGS02_20225 [Acidobacteriaceae bacterium]|nr:hypothetical protein [Acidobacteriaceae bacterium]
MSKGLESEVRRTHTNGSAIPDEASPAFILISRILVVLITVLLAVIPWSERYSLLDSFPHGQDTELNLLAFLVILGLILLILRAGRKQLRTFFAFKRVLLTIIRPATSPIRGSHHGIVLTDADRPPHPGSSLYNLPLLI